MAIRKRRDGFQTLRETPEILQAKYVCLELLMVAAQRDVRENPFHSTVIQILNHVEYPDSFRHQPSRKYRIVSLKNGAGSLARNTSKRSPGTHGTNSLSSERSRPDEPGGSESSASVRRRRASA